MWGWVLYMSKSADMNSQIFKAALLGITSPHTLQRVLTSERYLSPTRVFSLITSCWDFFLVSFFTFDWDVGLLGNLEIWWVLCTQTKANKETNDKWHRNENKIKNGPSATKNCSLAKFFLKTVHKEILYHSRKMEESDCDLDCLQLWSLLNF